MEGWRGSVQLTRCRRCGSIWTQSPGIILRGSFSSANCSSAAPDNSTTSSDTCWSYQKPGGLACPVEMMRSTRSPGRTSRFSNFSPDKFSRSGSLNRFPGFAFWFMKIRHFLFNVFFCHVDIQQLYPFSCPGSAAQKFQAGGNAGFMGKTADIYFFSQLIPAIKFHQSFQ